MLNTEPALNIWSRADSPISKIEMLNLHDVPSAFITDSMADALVFHKPNINAVIIRTVLTPAALAVAEKLVATKIRDEQMVISKTDEPDLVAAELDADWDLSGDEAADFYKNITNAVRTFQKTMSRTYLGVRIEIVDSDKCSNFHVDYVPMRLVQTLWGRGTEWLNECAVNRAGLKAHQHRLTKRPGYPVQRLETGWMAIMKGEKYLSPDRTLNTGRSFVHRSPAILNPAQPRLLLRIDEIIE